MVGSFPIYHHQLLSPKALYCSCFLPISIIHIFKNSSDQIWNAMQRGNSFSLILSSDLSFVVVCPCLLVFFNFNTCKIHDLLGLTTLGPNGPRFLCPFKRGITFYLHSYNFSNLYSLFCIFMKLSIYIEYVIWKYRIHEICEDVRKLFSLYDIKEPHQIKNISYWLSFSP